MLNNERLCPKKTLKNFLRSLETPNKEEDVATKYTVVCLAEAAKPAGDGRGTRFLQENGWWTPDPRLLLGPYEEELPASNTNAVFVTANNTMTTVQAGANALLRCRITDLADHETVSWIRRRDHHIITVGTHTYSNDDRFSVSFNHNTQDWTLQLKYAQMRDAGMYECQVSSHPPTSILTTLYVVQAVSVISGGPEVYAQHGSDVTLKCRMRNFTEPPTYVFWYHNSHMVNYDDEQRVSVLSRGGESTLRLRRVGQTDSGNYTCLPANAKPSSVLLHVIREEAPAAMQRARATTPADGLHAFLASLTLLLLAS